MWWWTCCIQAQNSIMHLQVDENWNNDDFSGLLHVISQLAVHVFFVCVNSTAASSIALFRGLQLYFKVDGAATKNSTPETCYSLRSAAAGALQMHCEIMQVNCKSMYVIQSCRPVSCYTMQCTIDNYRNLTWCVHVYRPFRCELSPPSESIKNQCHAHYCLYRLHPLLGKSNCCPIAAQIQADLSCMPTNSTTAKKHCW